jgi:hypothetical protein
MQQRPLLRPFDADSARLKVRAAEDAWNTRDPQRVFLAYTPDCEWRNRTEFLAGRAAIIAFLERKWARELDYRLIKEIWAHGAARIHSPGCRSSGCELPQCVRLRFASAGGR